MQNPLFNHQNNWSEEEDNQSKHDQKYDQAQSPEKEELEEIITELDKLGEMEFDELDNIVNFADNVAT
jgi:uncharacterized FlaG/YvyC family protein